MHQKHPVCVHLVAFANQGGSLGVDAVLYAGATFADQGNRRSTFGRPVEADEVAHGPSLSIAAGAGGSRANAWVKTSRDTYMPALYFFQFTS